MSSSIASSLGYIAKQITIYLGTFTLVAGVVGGFLTTVVFLSLRTFRESPCAFYLTIMSIVNIGQMLTGLLSRIVTTGFNIDWSQTSLFFCKFRYYCFQICSLTSMTCICLATIDQYLITCTRPRWQRWSNIKLARRLVVIFVVIWILHNTPYLIYYNHVESISTSRVTCINTNNIFQQYMTYGISLFFGKVLPISITFFFGFLAYRNVQQLSHRVLPLVRRELDKQLTVMILLLVVFSFFTMLPYIIVNLLTTVPQLTQDAIVSAQLQLATTLTFLLVYAYFAVGVHRYIFLIN